MGILTLERVLHQRETLISKGIISGAHVSSHAILYVLLALDQMRRASLGETIIAWSWRCLLCFDLTPLGVYLHAHGILGRCLCETVVMR